jgi:hypothetical protein
MIRARDIALTLTAFVTLIAGRGALDTRAMGTTTATPVVASFGVDPSFTACPPVSSTTVVKATWDVRNHVSLIAIKGAVDKLGIPLPLSFRNRSGKRSHRTVKLRVVCNGTNQILVLTATGPGGTTNANATIREQSNP